MSNIITATFEDGETSIVTTSQYMWAKGQILQIEGIDDLPSVYRVNFSNSVSGQSKTQIGTEDGVIIPDVFFTTGKDIYAWVVVAASDSAEEIEYDIHIPILDASEPEDDETTEEETSIITQAINQLSIAVDALNTATETVGAAVTKLDTLLFNINDTGELIYTYEQEDEEESD